MLYQLYRRSSTLKTTGLETFEIVAKTFYGLEDVLAEEVKSLGADQIKIQRRAVSYKGDESMLYKSNICLRTALRVLKPIHNSTIDKAVDLYDVVRSVNWQDHFKLHNTFIVDPVVFSGFFTNSHFVAQRTKDAIVDQFREKYGQRPSVDQLKPHIRINVHVVENRVSLALDSSGESLHKRGYKTRQTKAPLNEVLAAGLVLISGWKPDTSFVDPMSGSGTIPIEAALIAKKIPPGLFRKEFGFMHWKNFDRKLYNNIKNEIISEKKINTVIAGYDISPEAIAIATENAKNAGLAKLIRFQELSFENSHAPGSSGTLITNPPYGERLKISEIEDFYETIGNVLKMNYTGFDAWILSGNADALKKVGLRAEKKITLFNGPIKSRFYKYSVYSGKMPENIDG